MITVKMIILQTENFSFPVTRCY